MEAFAEALHERVRKALWAYATDEALDAQALIAERYPRHPACSWLPGLPRPQRETPVVPALGCDPPHRRQAH